MRIGIDARFYGPTGKGLGRYTQEIVDNIIKIVNADKFSLSEKNTSVLCSDNVEFVIFLNKYNFDEFVLSADNIKKICLKVGWYSWQEQLVLPILIRREKLDLMHYPHFNVPIFTPCKFVVTIHDLILTHFPTLRATTLSPIMYFFKNLAYRFVIQQAIRRSQKVITVSKFTKDDLIKQFSISPDKIIVTYEGVADLSKGRDNLFVAKLNNDRVLEKYNISNNFLLYVGNAYPHKNLNFLLQAFTTVLKYQPSLKLVLVGKEDYFYKKVHEQALLLNLWQQKNIESPVVFAGYVNDKQLKVLYQEARAYVFPSLYEGFGLPPLEAMANNCPVICSDRASLPEVLGDAVLYFNPKNENDLVEKINKVISDDGLRQILLERGSKQIKKYSWAKCAEETLEIYKKVINEQ